MFTLIAENKYGEQLELTHNSAYDIVSIEGLDPPDATINKTHNADFDGSTFNSSYMNDRVITITLAINGPAEQNRIALYQYFKSKFPVRLYYKNGSRDVYIDGYVQRMPISFFQKKQVAQIVVNCPEPHFNGASASMQAFTSVNSLFEFPFSLPAEGAVFSSVAAEAEQSILNKGDVETGAIINIHATGAVTNPKIYNTTTGEHIILNQSLSAGDKIVINTIKGQKSITLYPTGGGSSNIIGKFVQGSSWLQLIPGDNVYIVTADANPENMEVYFIITDQYEGV